jgi:hypothetical protein
MFAPEKPVLGHTAITAAGINSARVGRDAGAARWTAHALPERCAETTSAFTSNFFRTGRCALQAPSASQLTAIMATAVLLVYAALKIPNVHQARYAATTPARFRMLGVWIALLEGSALRINQNTAITECLLIRVQRAAAQRAKTALQ